MKRCKRSVDIDKAWMAFRQFRDWRKEHEVRAIAFEESLFPKFTSTAGRSTSSP